VIDLATARACIAALATARGVAVIEPSESATYLDGAATLLSLIPGVGPIVAQLRAPLDDAQQRVSVTAPLPWGTTILLSRSAVVDGPSYLATGLHELVHVRQIETVGRLQGAADYLGSGELRAMREAEASGIGLWGRYVVTGELPAVDDASILRSSLYHLDATNHDDPAAPTCTPMAAGVGHRTAHVVQYAAMAIAPPPGVLVRPISTKSWFRDNAGRNGTDPS
jgi:hypothetical protein